MAVKPPRKLSRCQSSWTPIKTSGPPTIRKPAVARSTPAKSAGPDSVVGLFACAGMVGCGGGKPIGKQAPTVSLPNAPAATAAGAASFAEAVTEYSPDDQQPPPDRTLNGHSTGKLRLDVQRQWEQVAL